jgi:phosphoribosylformimino-5-aminoimidazole carboxamide ribotide isomerase
VAAARAWAGDGARFLHVVDLDGARQGRPVNLEHVEKIAREIDLPLQLGGGLRSLPDVRDALRAGASRVILGTAAYTDVEFLDEVLAAFGDRVIVSVDVRGGKVSSAGWTEQTQMPAGDVIARLQKRGVRQFVYSSIERDGMLSGPDLDEVRAVSHAVRGRFLYSGGVGSVDDLRALADLRQLNLAGVIVGKALYERRFGVAEGQAALDEA